VPRRRKADTLLTAALSMQSQADGRGDWQLGDNASSTEAKSSLLALSTSSAAPATPRGKTLVRGSIGRAMLSNSADLGVPELPLISESNDVHGILVLGGKEAGKTSLVFSLAAAVNGTYPCGFEVKEKRERMPAHGQNYEIPECEVTMAGSTSRQMRVLITDTLPCGTDAREEQPLCARVSPHSSQPFQMVPSWMRITLRSGNFPHYAVLFCVDSTAEPLWEDTERCRDLARLLGALKRNQYTVVVAVTKLLKAREDALRDKNLGRPGGMDPRNSYEAFAGRYVEKVGAVIQAAAGERAWPMEAGGKPLLQMNETLFDVPTWSGAAVFKSWHGQTHAAQPNLRYATMQLRRVLAALCTRPHSYP